VAARRLRIKRSDLCAGCATQLAVGTYAVWDASARTVTCLACADGATDGEAGPDAQPLDSPAPLPSPLERGKPGASAEREYVRRRDARAQRARNKLGRLGGIYLALSSEPQSQVAWARGSAGEKLLGEAFERMHDEEQVVVLHDRRIPQTRANIDHIAVTRSGAVWAIDAKNYQGKVHRIDKGGWFATDERLYVGRRDCTMLVTSMAKQTEAIRSALGDPMISEFEVETRAALCFVDAEWSLFAKPMLLNGVWVGWGKALRERLAAPGHLDADHLMLLARRIADVLPPA